MLEHGFDQAQSLPASNRFFAYPPVLRELRRREEPAAERQEGPDGGQRPSRRQVVWPGPLVTGVELALENDKPCDQLAGDKR